MTKHEKENIAKQILKIMEDQAKQSFNERWHSYMLGSLEVRFEGVFSRLSDEEVEHYKKIYNLKN
jgi:hypothetical protein